MQASQTDYSYRATEAVCTRKCLSCLYRPVTVAKANTVSEQCQACCTQLQSDPKTNPPNCCHHCISCWPTFIILLLGSKPVLNLEQSASSLKSQRTSNALLHCLVKYTNIRPVSASGNALFTGLCSEAFEVAIGLFGRSIHRLRLDWIEQGLTSPPTQYRLSGRQFYRSKDPTNSIKVLKEKLASQTGRGSKPTRGLPPCYKWTSEKEKPFARYLPLDKL